jgi:hypothetical protein
VAQLGIAVLRGIQFPSDMIAPPTFVPDRRALGVSLAVAMASAILAGLGPAIQTTRVDLAGALKSSDQAGRGRRRLRARPALVAIQVALSLVLLTVSTFAFRMFNSELRKGPGFRTTQIAKVTTQPRGQMVLLAHTNGPSASALDALRAVARRPNPAVPVFDAQTIERFYYVLVEAQFGTVLRMIGGIGLMGMALTMVGLYGLVSYAVSRRTREIGIRMAVGATHGNVVRMVLRQSMFPVARSAARPRAERGGFVATGEYGADRPSNHVRHLLARRAPPRRGHHARRRRARPARRPHQPDGCTAL